MDDDVFSLKMKRSEAKVPKNENNVMRFEVFKVIPIFEKGRLGNRRRYRVYVGYGMAKENSVLQYVVPKGRQKLLKLQKKQLANL